MKTTQAIFIRLAVLLLFPLISCEKTIIEKAGEGKLYSIEGHAQKGPFTIGSNVTVAELNDKLFPTGRVFFSTILNDEGYFELPGVVLESPYVQIKVEGLFYSEHVGGVDTGTRLTLFSLADIRDVTAVNVNVLTHLEKERVEYLVQSEEKSFKEAKKQALNELLGVFNLENLQVQNSSDLVIFTGETGNAILLTISSIIDAVPSDMIEFITLFQKDMEDGSLDSEAMQTTLLNTAAYRLNPEDIKSNLTLNFPDKEFPDFEQFVNKFIANSTYTNYFKDVFPTLPTGTINLLQDTTVKMVDPTKTYVLAFKIPKGVNVHIGANFEGHSKPGEGEIDASSEFWLQTNLYECPQSAPDFCENQQSFWADVSGKDMEDIYIPVTFTGHGVWYYYFWIDVENYVWGRIEKTNLKW